MEKNSKYALVAPKKIKEINTYENFKNKIILKPLYLSICSADQRYYFGERNEEILKNKLPLVLIHECLAIVHSSNNKNFKKGDWVVPFTLVGKNSFHEWSNYNLENKFLSSDVDGFMKKMLYISERSCLKVPKNKMNFVFVELVSVCLQAIKRVKKYITPKKIICIWGDGNLSFILHLIVQYFFPKNRLYIIGKHNHKLNIFNKNENICKQLCNEINRKIKFDICFECVGGKNHQYVINQIVSHANTMAKINILGVSEGNLIIPFREITSKGIEIIGSSRSDFKDFLLAIQLINKDFFYNKISKIISNVIEVKKLENITYSFEVSKKADFKTIMIWKI